MSGSEILFGLAATAGTPAGAAVAGATATAAIAPTAATAGLFGAGGEFAFAQAVSTGLSAFGAFSSIAGGFMTASSQREQARWSDFQARQELVKGQQQQNAIREQALKDLASNAARYAASGIDITTGTPETVQKRVLDESGQNLNIARTNSLIEAGSFTTQARVLRARSRAARLQGVGGAALGLLEVQAV